MLEPPAPAVRASNLGRSFGDVRALDGVSLDIPPGGVYGLLGPNGAGKTTTLRILTTLLTPDAGQATVAGWDVRRERLKVRASIGYVPQALSADANLTVGENLEFYARVTGVSRRRRPERIAAAVESMELSEILGRLAGTLSGGMLRRLEIATALLNQPVVLFLDEPTVGLDPSARRLVWDRLAALREEAGTTVVVTTHLMEEAERHCHRLAILDRGRIVAEGAPERLRAEHAVDTLEEVFTTATGRDDEIDEGRIRDVRAQRRMARRLG